MKWKLVLLLLAMSCQKRSTSISGYFEIVNIDNIVHNPADSLKQSSSETMHISEIQLVNMTNKSLKVLHKDFFGENYIPYKSIYWIKNSHGTFKTFQFFKRNEFDIVDLKPKDTITSFIRRPSFLVFDSIVFYPELMLNDSKLELKFTFHKNDNEDGYVIKNNISYPTEKIQH